MVCGGVAPVLRFYVFRHTEAKLVSPAASAAKLIGLLNANEFVSGAHIDYYDV